jgi:hypothetical protein
MTRTLRTMTGGRFADWRRSRLDFVEGCRLCSRATKEANLPAARQSAIKTGYGPLQ